MTISLTQFAMVLAAAGPAAEAEPSASVPVQRAGKGAEADAEAEPPAQAEPSGPKLSTDLRIDDQRRIYYEVINNRTGDVVYEIPPEQIRKLEEGIDASLSGQLEAHTLDVKS
jgi:hypothetical protein